MAHPPTNIGPFTISGDSSRFGILTTGPTLGQHPTDGTQYLAFNALHTALGGEIRFTFGQPVMALALDIVDFGDQPLVLGATLTLSTSAGDSVVVMKTIADFDPPNGNVFFFGFHSDTPLTEVTFITNVGDNAAIDAVRYGPVPEPSAIHVLALVGFWLLACYPSRGRPMYRLRERILPITRNVPLWATARGAA